MDAGKAASEAQLKLWTRRVKAEMEKGTSPEDALELIKKTMEAQAAGERTDDIVKQVEIGIRGKREGFCR